MAEKKPFSEKPSGKTRKEEKKILYYTSHKLLCPNCEQKPARELIIENMMELPMLVKTKCSKCGYDGMLVEVRI